MFLMHADVPKGKEVHAVINIELKSMFDFEQEETLVFQNSPSEEPQLQVFDMLFENQKRFLR